MGFIDNVLIRLKRQYSKDELVSTLNKKISELEIENGKLLSEIEYLNDEIKKQIKQKNSDLKKSPLWEQQQQISKRREEKIKRLEEDNRKLIARVLELTK